MINYILNLIFGSPSEREVKKLRPFVDKVSMFEKEVSALSDGAILSKREEFSRRHKEGESIEAMLPEAFAVAREACRRAIGMRPFDVQLIGGAVLYSGKIAEMTTGEGKTLVAVLPVYVHSITGNPVHVVTVNDYLARRDAEWMGPAYRALGLSVGFVQSDMEPHERRKEYACDVTYVTNNELGFDYLRDNMAVSPEHQVLRDLSFAIIDEVDSVLIDEARTPLIISGPAGKSSDKYKKVDRIIPSLKIKLIADEARIEQHEKEKLEKTGEKAHVADKVEAGFDAIVEEKHKSARLTEEGIKKAEELLGVDLFDDITGEWVHHLNQALRAHHAFKKEIDYVVKDGQVIIVDEFTGRLMPGRRWSDGLHQAIEAKENLSIKRENQTLATITFQNFFNLYDRKAGMTGTAMTEQAEFFKIYELPVVEIPTNRELKRHADPDAIYKTEREKFNAIIDMTAELTAKGAPVLIGTRSIEASEKLSGMLQRRGVKHNVLNAKYHTKEAEIIAQAGRKGNVTISTNMAGRGTDIVLGGNPEYLAKKDMEKDGYSRELILAASEKAPAKTEEEASVKKIFAELYEGHKKHTSVENREVVEAGGLHVLGSERHESRRVDNQLRGRAGRQGDPGFSKFFISFEDELMRLFGSEKRMTLVAKMMEEGESIEFNMLSGLIGNAQKRVESMNFDIRKQLLEYDNVMDKQRRSIYTHRNRILKGEALDDELQGFIEDNVDMILEETADIKRHPEEWDLSGMTKRISDSFGLKIPVDPEAAYCRDTESLRAYLEDTLKESYEKRKNSFGPEEFADMERMILLQVMDSRWKDHLYDLDQIKESVSFSGYAQKDPLVEYKRASFHAFASLMDSIKKEVLTYIFRSTGDILSHALSASFGETIKREAQLPVPEAGGQQGFSGSEGVPGKDSVKQHRADRKVGRNDPCPCGSGRKYKHCCG
jgi:preprotein translocase subunit SecA